MKKSLGIIGCGNMAYAILKGLLEKHRNDFSHIYVSDIIPERENQFVKEFSALALDNNALIEQADLIFLAVKPQQMKKTLISTQKKWTEKKLLISLAAGVKSEEIEKLLEKKVPVIRVMSNTPALVQEGMTVICQGRYASEEDAKLTEEMMSNVGKVMIVDEDYVDAITVVSGSGPAYLFLITEAMMDAAINIGLDKKMSKELIIQTMKGSIKMLENKEDHPAVLRQEVSSPAGITITAIKQLEDHGVRKAFFNAFEKAYLRTKELSRN